jgi:crossover junction endodeoxyribonuclease RuvC
VTVEACGAIRTGKTDPISVRLLTIFTTINEILDRFKPDCLAIESAFYGNNVSSLIAMGRSSGIVLLAAAGRGIEVFEYAPRDIKKSVVGNGGASKEQVQRMVCAILEMERRPSPLDATDALAVALCHQNKAKRLAMDLG